MIYSNEIYIWILNVLFIIGLLLIPVGLGFMLCPEKIFKQAIKLNRWVSTDSFFNVLNTPHYKEHYFYRHHKIFSSGIIFLSIICFYMLVFYIGIAGVTDNLIKMAESEFENWLFVVMYYLLIVGIFLAFIFGVFMFIRPSALKTFESWGNRWIDTDERLKILDKQQDLPDRILPGNPRIFGFVVILSAIYIIWNVHP